MGGIYKMVRSIRDGVGRGKLLENGVNCNVKIAGITRRGNFLLPFLLLFSMTNTKYTFNPIFYSLYL